MTLLLALAVLLGAVAPETATSWMDPGRLGLALGMTRADAARELARRGRTTEPGKEPEHLIVPIDERRTVTLAFDEAGLRSIRFELVGFIPEIERAFAEAKRRLEQEHGPPTRAIQRPAVLQYDATAPKIYVVAATDRTTSFGRKGLGFLVIRYFEAPPER